MSKREEKLKRIEEVRNKQLEEAFKYPFCRRCKERLDEKWVKKLKKEGSLPLCQNCLGPMQEQFKKTIELWQKFNQR